MTTQAFWIPEKNNVFRAMIHAQGCWNPQFQHGGPPVALLVDLHEHCTSRREYKKNALCMENNGDTFLHCYGTICSAIIAVALDRAASEVSKLRIATAT
jgi:hypothetical protein